MSIYREKYPWLRMLSMCQDKILTDYDAYDDIPEGWAITFGEMMLEELDAAIKKHGIVDSFVFYQVKEKFGQLVCYTSANPIEHKDILEILQKYKALSANICLICGKPDTHITYTGWVTPLCETCFEKHIHSGEKYEDVLLNHDADNPNDIMVNTMESYTLDKNRDRHYYTVDISETAERIRRLYKQRMTSNPSDSTSDKN